MIVYKTINLINGKIYIGQDSNNNPNYLGSGVLLLKALKKYKKENFQKEILEYCSSIDQLNTREIFWIQFFNSTNRKIGYNLTNGGNTTLGYKYKLSKETIEKYKKGKNNPMYGKKHKKKSKEKMKKAKIGKCEGEKNNRARKLYEYDDNGNLLKIWNYCKEAADFYNISRGNISFFANINTSRKLNEPKKKLKGHIFSFSIPFIN